MRRRVIVAPIDVDGENSSILSCSPFGSPTPSRQGPSTRPSLLFSGAKTNPGLGADGSLMLAKPLRSVLVEVRGRTLASPMEGVDLNVLHSAAQAAEVIEELKSLVSALESRFGKEEKPRPLCPSVAHQQIQAPCQAPAPHSSSVARAQVREAAAVFSPWKEHDTTNTATSGKQADAAALRDYALCGKFLSRAELLQLSLTDLRCVLKSRGLLVSGTKTVLIDRILAHQVHRHADAAQPKLDLEVTEVAPDERATPAPPPNAVRIPQFAPTASVFGTPADPDDDDAILLTQKPHPIARPSRNGLGQNPPLGGVRQTTRVTKGDDAFNSQPPMLHSHMSNRTFVVEDARASVQKTCFSEERNLNSGGCLSSANGPAPASWLHPGGGPDYQRSFERVGTGCEPLAPAFSCVTEVETAVEDEAPVFSQSTHDGSRLSVFQPEASPIRGSESRPSAASVASVAPSVRASPLKSFFGSFATLFQRSSTHAH